MQSTLRRRETFPDRGAVMQSYRGRGAFTNWSEAELFDYVAAGFHDTPEGEVKLACRPAWEALMYAIHDYDPAALLGGLRRPARVYVSEKNSTMGDEARGLASGLEVVPATTHFLPMERPQFVREALLAAVQDVEKQ